MGYEVPDVSAECVLEASEGLRFADQNGRGGMSVQRVADYINRGAETARRALLAAEQLRLAERRNCLWFPGNGLEAASARQEYRQVMFRQALQRFRPFLLYVTLLGNGDSSADSARKVSVVFDVAGDHVRAEKTLRNWGVYAGILTRGPAVRLVEDDTALPPEYILRLSEALKDELRSKIYIVDKMGPDVLAHTDDDALDSLCRALSSHGKHPASSVDEAGKALEDALRCACVGHKLNAQGKNGIGSLAALLEEKGLITEKHRTLALGVNAIRIMGAHGRDKETLQRWTLRADSALESVLLVISTIRSIWTYVDHGNQVL